MVNNSYQVGNEFERGYSCGMKVYECSSKIDLIRQSGRESYKPVYTPQTCNTN